MTFIADKLLWWAIFPVIGFILIIGVLGNDLFCHVTGCKNELK